MDDTVFWDEELEGHWWRVIEFLETTGRSGIILNPDKFQFCAKDVKFAGFRITESRVAPLAKYIDAIRLFPTPQKITDIRSWFGLVNQVTGYGQLRSYLQPFRKFLSPKVKFEWIASLEEAFNAGKNEIIRVQIFDP